ncbi:MAG: hypothetical protein KY475_21460 [Planctomycetes bacterium]|nr:hypothetical protein [Planctomycetota bacterium]
MANHVRIDRVTQGPDGHETPADRLRVNSEDFLWIYVEAELPSGIAPEGEYFKMVGDKPDPATKTPLGAPTMVGGQYRFSVIHYVLSKQSKYLFHFADDLNAPNYEDQWEVVTV